METIFITGATGYIGGSVAARLIANGFAVRGLARSADSARQLADRGITPVAGDLDATAVLEEEARGADGVINTASADHAGCVQALIRGLAGSSKPLIHTSGSSVVGDDARGAYRSEDIFDEATPFVVQSWKQARRELDLLVLDAAHDRIRTSVICPSLIYGIGRGVNTDSVQIPLLARNAREQGVVQVVGNGLNVWSNVHIDDVAELYELVLKRGTGGALYFAENGEASFEEVGAALSGRLGVPGVEHLPAEEAARRWGESKAFLTLGSNSRVRGLRARRELGWAPTHSSATDWILEEMPVGPASVVPLKS